MALSSLPPFFPPFFLIHQIGPQLVSLELKGARIIEGATFRDMVCRFQSMRYLSLDGTFYVKSDAMSALASAGQQLQEVCAGFRLAFFNLFSQTFSAPPFNAEVSRLISTLERSTVVENSKEISDFSFCNSFPQVSLCGFRQLKDEDVQLLLDSCPVLTALSVADCTTLGALVLSSFQLQTLDVSRCIHISEMSLVMPCKALVDVCFNACCHLRQGLSCGRLIIS